MSRCQVQTLFVWVKLRDVSLPEKIILKSRNLVEAFFFNFDYRKKKNRLHTFPAKNYSEVQLRN